MRGRGVIVAEFFDTGESRTLAWPRRPQAAALVAALADPDRGWDAIVIGEYERAFYGSQYASMAPLFEHYGVQLWMPEVGGRVDWHAEDHEETMLALGLSSKREITRTRIRVRTAMATQTREQGRYLGGRPPYGYRLADAGPHPNKAHAAWGRRAHRLEPDPETAPVVTWMFAQRLAGHSTARITRALNDAGVPCPSAADPGRNPHRTGAGWTLRHRRGDPGQPAVHGPAGVEPAADRLRPGSTRPTPPSGTGRCSGGTCPKAGSSPNGRRTRRWSARPTSSRPRTLPRRAARPRPAVAPVPAGRAADLRAVRAAAGISVVQRQGPPTGAATATPAPPCPIPAGRRTSTCARTSVLPHLAALSILLAGGGTPGRGRRAGITAPARTADLIDQLRATGTVLTYDPGTRTIRAGDGAAVAVTAGQRS